MQHNKTTKKIEKIEKVSYNDNKITESLSDVIEKFSVKRTFAIFDPVKRCGIIVSNY